MAPSFHRPGGVRPYGLLCCIVTVVSCRERPPQFAGTTCRVGWRPETGPNATFTVCVPPGFARAGSDSTSSGKPDTIPRLWASILSIEVREAVPEDYGFPRSLRRWTQPRNCIDCAVATELVVVTDTVGPRIVPVQTGVLGPGEAAGGPALFASWQVKTGAWVMVQGRAEKRASLDTLRAILRTLRVRGDSVSDDPDRPPNDR